MNPGFIKTGFVDILMVSKNNAWIEQACFTFDGETFRIKKHRNGINIKFTVKDTLSNKFIYGIMLKGWPEIQKILDEHKH